MAFNIATPEGVFHAPFYIRHNQRRLEHLASLGLDLFDKTVLEPGAGIGDHSLFYLDRGCLVTAVEPRAENVAAMRANIGSSYTRLADRLTIVQGDTDVLSDIEGRFDIVHSYGLLYHLDDPERAIALFADRCADLLILETCVTIGNEVALNPVPEPVENPSQAFSGMGCRPTRPWVMQALKRYFPHVMVPRTQPAHDEFPLDWTRPWTSTTGLTRAIFIAARRPLNNLGLLEELPDFQTYA